MASDDRKIQTNPAPKNDTLPKNKSTPDEGQRDEKHIADERERMSTRTLAGNNVANNLRCVPLAAERSVERDVLALFSDNKSPKW
jgi:hypothetical protein